ncbi:hypothetical protein EVAR_3673_1 [Eumeta japonica]|uniref:Uncharacterized protein n=1 Tax=Eumeta variegata TaxID=151549 RepID=A0A4C1SU39_EUMVA|nr:hypothetical protein EVAR_3673_1 [Eumeta japonica]
MTTSSSRPPAPPAARRLADGGVLKTIDKTTKPSRSALWPCAVTRWDPSRQRRVCVSVTCVDVVPATGVLWYARRMGLSAGARSHLVLGCPAIVFLGHS